MDKKSPTAYAVGDFFCEDEESNLSKCGADERRRRGLDRAAHLFLPFGAKMQIESLILALKSIHICSVLFRGVEGAAPYGCTAWERVGANCGRPLHQRIAQHPFTGNGYWERMGITPPALRATSPRGGIAGRATPHGGLSCPYGAIHLLLAPTAIELLWAINILQGRVTDPPLLISEWLPAMINHIKDRRGRQCQ